MFTFGDDESPRGGRHNVLGTALAPCCPRLRAGAARDGHCRYLANDPGEHVVCAQVDARFLKFTASRNNDLSTPRPEFDFPGLKPGDRWCLCAVRWQEALDAGAAPPVILEATDEKALDTIARSDLQKHAVGRGGRPQPR